MAATSTFYEYIFAFLKNSGSEIQEKNRLFALRSPLFFTDRMKGLLAGAWGGGGHVNMMVIR